MIATFGALTRSAGVVMVSVPGVIVQVKVFCHELGLRVRSGDRDCYGRCGRRRCPRHRAGTGVERDSWRQPAGRPRDRRGSTGQRRRVVGRAAGDRRLVGDRHRRRGHDRPSEVRRAIQLKRIGRRDRDRERADGVGDTTDYVARQGQPVRQTTLRPRDRAGSTGGGQRHRDCGAGVADLVVRVYDARRLRDQIRVELRVVKCIADQGGGDENALRTGADGIRPRNRHHDSIERCE